MSAAKNAQVTVSGEVDAMRWTASGVVGKDGAIRITEVVIAGDSLTSDDVYAVPVKQIRMMLTLEHQKAGLKAAGRKLRRMRELLEPGPKTSEWWAAFAENYTDAAVWAVEEGRTRTQVLAWLYQVSEATIRHWTWEARQEGALPPAPRRASR